MSRVADMKCGQRIIIETIDDMPSPARGGVPLGSILERTDDKNYQIVAYGQGGTWSQKGLQLCARDLHKFTATFMGDDEDDDGGQVKVFATDIPAVLTYLRQHFVSAFGLFVDPAPVFLGEFKKEGQD